MNHFANVCQGGGFRKSSKPVHTLRSEADTEGTGDDGQLFVGTLFIGDIQANDWQTKLRVNDTLVTFKLDTGAQANDWQTKLRVNDTLVTFKLDTGAQANVLPVNVYRRIKPNKPRWIVANMPRTKPLNKAIKRERYEIPTPADVQSQLGDKQIFNVIDMKDGYWHVKLTEESSHLCTFYAPWGRRDSSVCRLESAQPAK